MGLKTIDSHLLFFFPFSFLILAVEMGWMGHYMASHLMLHLFFLFLFHIQPYVIF
jgi:hypothetical protein